MYYFLHFRFFLTGFIRKITINYNFYFFCYYFVAESVIKQQRRTSYSEVGVILVLVYLSVLPLFTSETVAESLRFGENHYRSPDSHSEAAETSGETLKQFVFAFKGV